MSSESIRQRGLVVLNKLFAQPRVHQAGQSMMLAIASKLNYHVLRGMGDPAIRPDVGLFSRASPWKITQDYVRDATLELLCREIDERQVPGALAELGVFRGDFAWLMSTYLPGRPVHLFDTFEGFHAADVTLDASEDLVPHFLDFSATHPATVAARFPQRELVTLHVGRFPGTTEGVDGQFALVSIDADLYAPMVTGLRWFYERLSPGGAILAHDFNNVQFGGARKAVREFQRSSGATIVPLPDWGGTAVVVKPGSPAYDDGPPSARSGDGVSQMARDV